MNHVLVFPCELEEKLVNAYNDADVHEKWLKLGVDTVDDMKQHILNDLNNAYSKLSVVSLRFEKKEVIKERIKNSGNTSIYVGYIENEAGNVIALSCYVPPKVDNANDYIPAKIIPPLLGINKNSKDAADLHINFMPVFIIGLCTTTRTNNSSVKKQIVCCEALGFNYCDIFKNEYLDVFEGIEVNGKTITRLNKLAELDSLLGGTTDNKWFEVDYDNKTIKILSKTVEGSPNITSEIYRLSLFTIPAVYFAVKEGYSIDVSEISEISGDIPKTLVDYILKF